MRERALLGLFASIDSPAGPIYECKYYPCHFNGQDCSFCYCPFYPCFLYRLGGELILRSGKYYWSCKKCSWIHKKEVVEEVVLYFSSIPRQILVEADWMFFNRCLQEILFGRELGKRVGNVYDLNPPNFYGLDCRDVENSSSLLIELEDFSIKRVIRVERLNDLNGGILIPEKMGSVIRGFRGSDCIECKL